MSALTTEVLQDCLLCGIPGGTLFNGLHDRLYSVQGEFAFARCPSCGLVWESPRPTRADIPRCYPDDYEPHETGAGAPAIPRLAAGMRDTVRALILSETLKYDKFRRMNWWAPIAGRLLGRVGILRRKARFGKEELCPPFVSGGTLLDVGCGAAGYLGSMKALGWDVLGVDPSPLAAQVAHDSYKVPVRVGTLETVDVSDKRIAVVTMIHSIEHVPDPIATLRRCREVLMAGGRIVLTTPNYAGLMSLLFRRHWMCLEPPRHLWLFTPATLRTCVERAGFRVERVLTRPFLSQVNYEKSLRIREQGHARGSVRPSDAGALARALDVLERGVLPFWRWAGNELMLSAVKDA